VGIAPDRREDIAKALHQGLSVADMVLVSGGVSVGDYDLTAAACRMAGAEVLCERLDQRRGRGLPLRQKTASADRTAR
jgi:molybdopterin molybdotransferase